MKTIEKAKSLIAKIKTGWREPPEGRFLNIQEIAAYGVGGMGLHFMFSLLGYSITAQMLPKMYGITPTQAALLVTLVSIIKLVVMPWFYSVFDNLHSEKGKYRSFISVLAPLLALFSVLATFAPQFTEWKTARRSGLFMRFVFVSLYYFYRSCSLIFII